MLGSLGRLAYRRRRIVVVIWLALLAAGLFLGGRVFSELDPGTGMRDDVESARASDRVEELGGTGPDIAILVDGQGADNPAVLSSVRDLSAELRQLPHVRAVFDANQSGADKGLVARDERAQLVTVELEDSDLSATERGQLVEDVEALAAKLDAPRVLVGGEVPSTVEFQEASQRDLQRGELIALPLVLLLLLVIFRGFVAPVLPLVVAVMSVAGTLLLLLGLSTLTDLSEYSVNVVTMVGLGLAVDYSLLIVSRFREERARGLELDSAIERCVATAGRTVAFSGLTVAVAVAGMLVFAEPLLRSMAWGAIGVVALTVAAALTLLPALLGMWGRKISAAPARSGDRGFFYRMARTVQRFAWGVAPLLVVALALLAIPFRDVQLGGSSAETLAETSASRQVAETVRDRFPGGGSDPIVVVADASAKTETTDLAARIGDLNGVTSVTVRPDTPSGTSILDVVPEGRAHSESAKGLVEDIRGLDTSTDLQVTGSAARLVDFQDSMVGRLPFALGFIALATFVLLFVMTRSLVLPVKAIIMNILSLGASLGALVWIFQQGHLSGVLDFTAVGSIDSALPVLLFIFAFGLSMDYEVFLLARIKESYDETGDNDGAVAVGLQRTGRIVTSAAALIVAVFLGFGLGDLLTIKALGIGLALAILIDATVVRMLLLPATMKLLGRWNWWAPQSLLRMLPGRSTAGQAAAESAEVKFRPTTPQGALPDESVNAARSARPPLQ
ncbi:MMPL family transporter [Streptomyces vastus]|uniref:MMPL family transporter n=1 Tax=Streptomyces vastus TaxID=285451 RepID=A0ABP6CQJ0_9ACTN